MGFYLHYFFTFFFFPVKIDLDEVQTNWEIGAGPHHLRVLAQHYGIFSDLFGNAYFVPRIALSIGYDYDEELLSPVYRGNTIKPREVRPDYVFL